MKIIDLSMPWDERTPAYPGDPKIEITQIAEVLKDGWCYSGDYGYFDEKGYLYFTGLKKPIVKVGGNVVDLVEVKNIIQLFSGVINAEVSIVADEIWGNLLTTEVLVRNPKEFNIKQLRSFLRNRLSSYKIPRLKIIGGK